MGNETTSTAHSTHPKTSRKRFLIVAEHRVGHGSGHLHRCARIAPRLDGLVHWLLPEKPQPNHYSRSEALAMIGDPNLPVHWVDEPIGPYDMVVLDRREATLAELQSYNLSGLCVGIDLAGEARAYCSYLIDALETPPETERPNIADTGLLHLPQRVRAEWPERIERVLVAFGGEESGAGAEIAVALAETGRYAVTIVARNPITIDDRVSVLIAKGDLPEKIADFDAVITHYGLTPYEAVWARVPTVLVNPSRYHSVLSREAGFPEARNASEVDTILRDPVALVERCGRARPRGLSDIASLINELRVPERVHPPSGSDRWQPAIERFAERTFFRDRENDTVYMQNYRGAVVEYGHDYFFSEYARQYGKTYLEDFPAIQNVGARRIRDILKNNEASEGAYRLLDIGCAYGPFLQAAAEARCRVTGLDISCEATEYVKNELGFPAICGDIRTLEVERFRDAPFDIVTMWYVIEHFEDLDLVIDRVTDLLKPGGVFAFSTPNGSGISGRSDFREFCRRSPHDHYSIMTPGSAARLFRRFGFRTKRVRITGHHPERFEFVPPGGKGIRFRLAQGISKIARLGDTFEYIGEYVP